MINKLALCSLLGSLVLGAPTNKQTDDYRILALGGKERENAPLKGLNNKGGLVMDDGVANEETRGFGEYVDKFKEQANKFQGMGSSMPSMPSMSNKPSFGSLPSKIPSLGQRMKREETTEPSKPAEGDGQFDKFMGMIKEQWEKFQSGSYPGLTRTKREETTEPSKPAEEDGQFDKFMGMIKEQWEKFQSGSYPGLTRTKREETTESSKPAEGDGQFDKFMGMIKEQWEKFQSGSYPGLTRTRREETTEPSKPAEGDGQFDKFMGMIKEQWEKFQSGSYPSLTRTKRKETEEAPEKDRLDIALGMIKDQYEKLQTNRIPTVGAKRSLTKRQIQDPNNIISGYLDNFDEQVNNFQGTFPIGSRIF